MCRIVVGMRAEGRGTIRLEVSRGGAGGGALVAPGRRPVGRVGGAVGGAVSGVGGAVGGAVGGLGGAVGGLLGGDR